MSSKKMLEHSQTGDNARCDKKLVAQFDYSRLSADFSNLSKPARRALLNNGICEVRDLAKKTESEVLEFHGLGPSALPILKLALAKHGLKFKSEPKK